MASRTVRRRSAYRTLGKRNEKKSHPFLRIVIVFVVGFAMLTSGASAGTLFFYGDNLPTLGSFKHRFQFQNTLIRDGTGRILYDMADMSKSGRGKRVVVPLIDPRHTAQYYQEHHQDWLGG